MKGLNRHIENADAAIFIVGHNTPRCAQMLRCVRSACTLHERAAASFEAGWSLYQDHYAKDGGAFGVLIHSRLRERGPVMAMGLASEVARVASVLSLKAREISRRDLTPLAVDDIFLATVRAVVAELSHTVGHA